MRTALVTGGARGLGRALTGVLVDRGYAVHVLDRLAPQGESDRVVHHELDLRSVDEARVRALPELDVVVLNAGVTAVGDFRVLSPAVERDLFESNVVGHMVLVKYLLRHGRIRRGGRVGVVCSASVYVPWPVGIAYAASKGALDAFAHALESYLSGDGVSVTRVYPGAMRTDHGGYASAKGVRPGVDPERIAPAIVRAVLRGRRRVFPDAMARVLVSASVLFPRTMARLVRRRLDLDAGGDPGPPQR